MPPARPAPDPRNTDRPVERQPGPSRRVCPLIGCVRTRGLVQWPRMGRPCSWLLGGSLSAAELAEERLDAVASRGVAFDLTVPSAAGCIVDELLFHGQAGVYHASATSFSPARSSSPPAQTRPDCPSAGMRRQWPSSSSVLRKLVWSQDTASGSRWWSRSACAAGPARVTSGRAGGRGRPGTAV